MKNVTVSLEECVADFARIEAARRNTSVSRLVGDMLAEKTRHDDAYGRAMNEWVSRDCGWKSNGAPYPGREKTHDRGLR